MNIPNVIRKKMQWILDSHPGKIGVDGPFAVDDGTLYVPFFDTPENEVPDITLPFYLLRSDGIAREIIGPSDEWFALVDQIPE